MDRKALNQLLETTTTAPEMTSIDLPDLGETIVVRPVRKLDVINAGMRLGDDAGEIPIEVLVAVLVAIAKDDAGQKLFKSVAEASRFMNALEIEDLTTLIAEVGEHIYDTAGIEPQVGDVDEGKASSEPSPSSSPS